MKSIFKNVGYTKQRIMQKFGAEKTIDVEFSDLYDRWERLYRTLSIIEQDLKKQKEGIIVIQPLFSLGEHLTHFYGEDERIAVFGTEYEKAVQAIIKGLRAYSAKQQQVENHVTAFLNSMTQMRPRFEERERAQLDYDKYSTAVKYESSKSAKELNKLSAMEVKCEEKRIAYESVNKKLKAEMSDLVNNRYVHFDSAYKLLLSSQMDLFSLAHNSFSALQTVFKERPEVLVPPPVSPPSSPPPKEEPTSEAAKPRSKTVGNVSSAVIVVGAKGASKSADPLTFDIDAEVERAYRESMQLSASALQEQMEANSANWSQPDSTSPPLSPSASFISDTTSSSSTAEAASSSLSSSGGSSGGSNSSIPLAAAPPESLIYPVFGKPLELVCGPTGVPLIVRRCVEYLSLPANVTEEGILRQSGNVLKIESLKRDIDEGKPINFTGVDCHAVSGVLKSYFRELPSPLIPVDINQKVSDLLVQVNNLEPTAVKEAMKTLVDSLPPPNYETVKFLTSFFVLVQKHSKKNLMTINNVLVCFAPTLKCIPGLFKYCVEDFDYFFPPA